MLTESVTKSHANGSFPMQTIIIIIIIIFTSVFTLLASLRPHPYSILFFCTYFLFFVFIEFKINYFIRILVKIKVGESDS